MAALALRSSIFFRSISSCFTHVGQFSLQVYAWRLKGDTHHLAHSHQRSRITCHQWPTVVDAIRLGDGDRIRDDDAGPVPPRRHRPAERIKQVLRLLGDTLAAARLALLQLRDGAGLAGLEGTDVERVQCRVGVCEGGPIGVVGGRSEGEELE